MFKPLHIQLLEILEPLGVSKYFWIKDFMTANFVVPSDDDFEIDEKNDLAVIFIKDLYEKKYIFYEEKALYGIHKLKPEDRFCTYWFDDFPVYISITIDGLEHLERYRLNQSIINSSEATIKGFWSALILSVLTVFITASTLIITYRNSNELSRIEQRIDNLSLQLQKMQLSRMPVQNPIALPVVPRGTH